MPTPTEDLLAKICNNSFLSLWSHPHPYRASKPVPHELCDLLVVFGDNVIVFSDKSIAFPEGDVEGAWRRWYKRAVMQSAKQLHGALRVIKDRPETVFADESCTSPLRAPLPDPLDEPFHIGRVDSAREFVHVFDEDSLRMLMSEIDTAPDFIEYLTKRKVFLGNPDLTVIAPGEEELVARYLTTVGNPPLI